MIKNIFNINFLKGNELVFFIYLLSIIIMVIVIFILGYRKTKK